MRDLSAKIRIQDWNSLEHHARELEKHTQDEPLPWSDFHIARARVLADWKRGNRDQVLFKRARALEAEARQASLGPAADSPAMALASSDGPGD